MQIVVVLYCLGNKAKKKMSADEQKHLHFEHSGKGWDEPMDTELKRQMDN